MSAGHDTLDPLDVLETELRALDHVVLVGFEQVEGDLVALVALDADGDVEAVRPEAVRIAAHTGAHVRIEVHGGRRP
ncbi:MAG TPA: hypothetical protein VFP61_05835, partial [Acidimicrobiales bacterium]|nr:hypothetical protein [Acidimicrobiales bacterium]